MTLKEMQEKRAEIAKRIREMADKINEEKREFNAEETKNWDTANKEYDEFGEKIDRQVRLDKIAADQAKKELDKKPPVIPGAPTEEDRSNAMRAWALHQIGEDVSEELVAVAELCGLNLNTRNLNFRLLPRASRNVDEIGRQIRAQSVGTDSEGGFTVPEGFVNNLEIALLAFGGMREVSDILRTATGNDLPWPTSDDTSNEGVLLAENTQVAEQDVVFASLVLQAFKYSSKLVRVSAELLQDSAFDIAAFLGTALGERLARIQNRHATVGTGAAQPNGVVTASTLGFTTAAAALIAADELIDLFHSLDPAYRANARWMMHDGIAKVVRKLKDGESQYLWQPGLQAGMPDLLLGKPVSINQNMQATVVTATKTILFGDFMKYKIREVSAVRMRRLVERYADFDQDGFVSFMRFDSDLLDAGTNPIRHLLQA